MTRLTTGLLTLAGLLVASETQAQTIVGPQGAYPVAGYTSYYSGYTGTAAPGSMTVAPSTAPATTPRYPYSYYAALPGPARGYVGYGQDQFPYHGRPYGHPYDPWTWPYLGRSYNASMARYYDPPVK